MKRLFDLALGLFAATLLALPILFCRSSRETCTGWAQVIGRGDLLLPESVKLDIDYLHRQSLWFDIRIRWRTFFKFLRCDGVSH